MHHSADQLAQHLEQLQAHLLREQPLLADLVGQYRQLDQIAYSMGLLPRHLTFAERVSWWPIIAVLGTFSAGKSTFINDYLEFSLQRTGHQAVDDKFTVMAYTAEGGSTILPGSALDADPRFPFYSMGREIEKVAKGEGRRIDSFMQLKTCPCEKIKGKILIDSPGFDADDQRTATLQITDRIIERSDLVMVFFDAHRPEPGAIRDTLEHLVEKVIERHDATKFLYVLNQIDVTADENNLEDVVAAWQRALAQKGLTAGRFYRTFSLTACTHIENEEARKRLLDWREQDMTDIDQRLHQVELDRVYRVADSLLRMAEDIEHHYVPALKELLRRWRRFVLWGDAILIGGIVFSVFVWLMLSGSWTGFSYTPPALIAGLTARPWLSGMTLVFLLTLFVLIHFGLRHLAFQLVRPDPHDYDAQGLDPKLLLRAFRRSTRKLRSIFLTRPAGWHLVNRRRLDRLRRNASELIQKMNDQHINPGGQGNKAASPVEAASEDVAEEGRQVQSPQD